MNWIKLLGTLFLTFTSATIVSAESTWRQDYVGIAFYTGSSDLEGPAVTALADGGEQEVDMSAVRLEAHKLLDELLYLRGGTDFSRLDGGGRLIQANASIGIVRSLSASDSFSLDAYLQGGVEYARSSNLDEYLTDPQFDGTGSGRSGDAIGASAEVGLIMGLWSNGHGRVSGKYISFGDGDGVAFGIHLDHDLSDAWTVTFGLEGVWVEDAGIQIDLDYQRFGLGLLRKF
jgi:hypothetical protein